MKYIRHMTMGDYSILRVLCLLLYFFGYKTKHYSCLNYELLCCRSLVKYERDRIQINQSIYILDCLRRLNTSKIRLFYINMYMYISK